MNPDQCMNRPSLRDHIRLFFLLCFFLFSFCSSESVGVVVLVLIEVKHVDGDIKKVDQHHVHLKVDKLLCTNVYLK